MINYRVLRWGNCFSYGDKNEVRFDQAPITQLVGKNGHGKSSIALILEEVLFNKNSKGIKKSSILNRNVSDKQYWIELEFEKDGSHYEIKTSRGSTQKISLYKDGDDISSHTATGTFKDIEALIGYDHNTFSQIVYQSSTQSLQFLTATDTQRKKFLIELLNLSKYTKALDLFKEASKEIATGAAVAESQMKTAQDWITKYSKEDLSERTLVPVPEQPTDLEKQLQEVVTLIANITSENKSRVQNNKYKELRDSVVLLPAPTKAVSQDDIDNLRSAIAVGNNKIATAKQSIKRLTETKTKCPTCGQALGVNHDHIKQNIEAASLEVGAITEEVQEATKVLNQYLVDQKAHKLAAERQAEWERYHAQWDPAKPSDFLDEAELLAKKDTLDKSITAIRVDIDCCNKENTKIAAHNAKVAVIKQQMQDMQATLTEATAKYTKLFKRRNNLDILVKAFSTTGLVAYKIECLVKDLEAITNEYLAEMADGRFQLSFQISASDKLNVVITDNGEDIDINALSSGERARVNIATLLAIRKLMQTLSNTRTNLLILDETISNLDAYGKEKLIEVLGSEEQLNTFLVSHDYEHPLMEKLSIVKENGISRIER